MHSLLNDLFGKYLEVKLRNVQPRRPGWGSPDGQDRPDGPNMNMSPWDTYRVNMSFSRSEFKFSFLGILDIKACKSVCLDLMYSAVAEELNFGLKYGS